MSLVGSDFLEHFAHVRRDRRVIEGEKIAQGRDTVAPDSISWSFSRATVAGSLSRRSRRIASFWNMFSFLRFSPLARKPRATNLRPFLPEAQPLASLS